MSTTMANTLNLSVAATPDSRKYRLRWWALAFVSLALAILAMDTTIVNVAVPEIQRDLGASASSMQWIIDSYYLVYAGLLLTMGSLGDRFGRRLLLRVGMAAFASASLFAAFAGSSAELISARALTGIGAATVTPATLSIIIDTFPAHERAKAIAIWSATAGIGVPLGQITGGALLEQFWWGSIFFVNLPVCAAVLLGSFTVISESRDPNARRIDPVGALLSTGTLASLVFGIIEAPSRGWTDPVVVGSLAASAAIALSFVLYELRLRFPMLDVRLLRNPGLSTGSIALVAQFLAMLGMLFLLTQYLQIGRGYSALETGLLMSPMPLGFAVGSTLSEKAALSFGANRVTSLGLVATGLPLLGLSLIGTHTELWIIEVLLLAFGLGGGAVMAPATAVMMRSVPEANAGVGGALTEVTRIIGIALGVSILGSIANSVFSSHIREGTAGLALQGNGHQDSIGAAARIASEVGGPTGEALRTAAENAFVDAFSVALIVGAAIALAAAALVLRWMPAGDTAPSPGDQQSIKGSGPRLAPVVGGADGERSVVMLKGLSGSTTWSEDLNNLLPFYRDTLGLKPSIETPGFIVFGDPQAPSFALGTHSEVKGKNTDPARHMVGFLTDDIEAEVKGLKSKGVEFVSDPEKFDRVTVATLKDPEGNYIQLLQFA